MKALVLAAGIGSRLKPWTDSHPKALIEVGGVPMLGRVIQHIIDAGIDDIVVNVHHFASQIIEYLESETFNAHISISDERDVLLDTGGAVRKVIPILGEEPLLIHNADILTTLSLSKFISAFEESHVDASLLVAPRDSGRRLVFSPDMKLEGWINLESGQTKPVDSSFDLAHCQMMSFNGIHIVSPSLYPVLWKYAADDIPFSIIDFYISRCTTEDIRGFVFPKGDQWWDVGRPATLEQARIHFS